LPANDLNDDVLTCQECVHADPSAAWIAFETASSLICCDDANSDPNTLQLDVYFSAPQCEQLIDRVNRPIWSSTHQLVTASANRVIGTINHRMIDPPERARTCAYGSVKIFRSGFLLDEPAHSNNG